jgi:hypothetical protein
MRTNIRGSLILALTAVLWFALVVIFYFVYHKPFELANVVGIAQTLCSILIAALLILLAAALGHRVLRAFDFSSALEAAVTQIGIGLGIESFIVFGLGWLGLLQPLVFWGLLLLGLLLLLRDVNALRRNVRTLQLPRATRGERALSWFILFGLTMTFVFALTPPTGWDGLQYHLVLPKLALQAGRFTALPDNVSLSYPGLVEMLFLAAMGLGSDSAAQLMHWVYLLLLVGAVLVFCARCFTWRVGWLASALLIAVPSLLLISTYAYNDAALMFYTLTALLWTLRAIETQRTRDFGLAGILAGLALGEKYTAVLILLALGALVLFQGGWRVPARRAFLTSALLVGVALVLCLPWLVRNFIVVGNPVYPFVFGGLYWDAWRSAWYSRFGTGLWNDPLQLLVVPWTMTVQGAQSGSFDATIGPLLLALLPFSLLQRRAQTDAKAIRAMWFLVAVLLAFWLLGVAQSKLLWQTRLLFPAFPLLAIFAAEGWERLAHIQLPQFSAQRFAALVIALVLGLNAFGFVLATVKSRPFQVLVGVETRQEFLARNLGAYYKMTQWVNANLPPDARVLTLWEPRAYYIDRTVDADAILDRFPHLAFLFGDAAKIAAEWQQQGFTHVVLYRQGLNAMLQSQYDPVGATEVRLWEDLEHTHLRLIYGSALSSTTNAGKLALRDADAAPYAVYEIVAR